MRGHGETEINEGITVKNFALDIIKLMEYLEIPSLLYAGFRLGGIVAQELYKQRPDLVRGLILSNTTSYIPAFMANKIINESSKLLQESEHELVEHIVTEGYMIPFTRRKQRRLFIYGTHTLNQQKLQLELIIFLFFL